MEGMEKWGQQLCLALSFTQKETNGPASIVASD